MRDSAPSFGLNVPEAHAAQVPLSRYVPGPQTMQAEAEVEPGGEKAPAGHEVQASEPGALEKVSPGHTLHSVAPGRLKEPGRHGAQSASEVEAFVLP